MADSEEYAPSLEDDSPPEQPRAAEPPEADRPAGQSAPTDADRAEPSAAGSPVGDREDRPAGPNVDLPPFQQVIADVEASGIDLLHDVDLNVKIELGRTHMLIEDVLKLAEGSVVELDKLAGDPVDVYVNERLVARGEVLVLNDNFCVRISEVITDAPRSDDAGEETAEPTAQAGGDTGDARDAAQSRWA